MLSSSGISLKTIAMSSAYASILSSGIFASFHFFNRSSINIQNRVGLIRLPCGTPLFSLWTFPLSLINELSRQNSAISIKFLSYVKYFSFFFSKSWETISKALLKSKNIIPANLFLEFIFKSLLILYRLIWVPIPYTNPVYPF